MRWARHKLLCVEPEPKAPTTNPIVPKGDNAKHVGGLDEWFKSAVY